MPIIYVSSMLRDLLERNPATEICPKFKDLLRMFEHVYLVQDLGWLDVSTGEVERLSCSW